MRRSLITALLLLVVFAPVMAAPAAHAAGALT